MSAESDFRAALLAHAPLVSLVGQRVAQNAIEAGQPAPYVVFTATHDPQHGLGGVLLGDSVTIEAQCWGNTAVQAASVADAVAGALVAVDAPAIGRATGYDPELGFDAVILTVMWITG